MDGLFHGKSENMRTGDTPMDWTPPLCSISSKKKKVGLADIWLLQSWTSKIPKEMVIFFYRLKNRNPYISLPLLPKETGG